MMMMMKKKMRDELSMSNGSRLSMLPDEILLNILSFLSIKENVQTSVLSKRYRHLYASLPDLIFDMKRFGGIGIQESPVDRVLALRGDSIRVNNLVFRAEGFKAPFDKAFNYAICNGVQQIDIIIIGNQSDLPASFYSSKSDTLLKLNLINEVNPDYINVRKFGFEQLVSLSLFQVMLKGQDIFSDCHSLRYLRLRNCYSTEDPATLNICAPQISKLIMETCWRYRPAGNKIMLSVPRLTVMDISIDVPVDISSKNCGLPPLETATIRFVNDRWLEPSFECLTTMLEFAHHAKFVRLSWNIIKHLSSNGQLLQERPSPFENLKSLKILPCPRYQYTNLGIDDIEPEEFVDVLTYLLKDSPNAELNGSPQPVNFRNFNM